MRAGRLGDSDWQKKKKCSKLGKSNGAVTDGGGRSVIVDSGVLGLPDPSGGGGWKKGWLKGGDGGEAENESKGAGVTVAGGKGAPLAGREGGAN